MPDNKQSFLSTFVYHLTMGIACQPKQLPLTPLRLATEHLKEARLDLLRHQHLSEFHAGTVETLKKRIVRLRSDIATITSTENKTDEQPHTRP